MSEEIRRRLASLVRPRDRWTPIDEALYRPENLYRVDDEEAAQLRFAALKHSFEYHYNNNGFYHRLCQSEKITPADIKEPSDYYKIPLIPDTFFKDYPSGIGFYQWLQKISSVNLPTVKFKKNNPTFDDVIEALHEHNFTVTFTSGSSGRYSFIPRDELTWLRQKYAFCSASAEILASEYENGDPHFIAMSCFSHPDKTFLMTGKVTSCAIDTLFDRENMIFMLDRKVTTESLRIAMGRTKGLKEKIMAKFIKTSMKKVLADFRNKIADYARQGRKVSIAAPPFMVEAMLSTLEAEGKELALGKNVFLGTGGGWKTPMGGALLDSNWRTRITKLLGIPEENIRDLYGMSECSAFFPDCEGHYKHIPSSIVYTVLLDDELKPISYGNFGRLAILDPVPNSYPGFIITGDRVKILEHCPVCDRPGPVFDNNISRIAGVEGRGCAAIAGDLMAQDLKKSK